MSSEQRIPNAPGWWARRWSGRIDWYELEELDETGLSIWLDPVNEYVPVAQFCTPLTRWYGPVELPWKEGP